MTGRWKWRRLLTALLAAALFWGSADPVLAKEERVLTVHLGREDCEAKIFLYRVGQTEGESCVTGEAFAGSGVDLNGLDCASDVREAVKRLDQWREQEGICADAEGKTQDGTAAIPVLDGVYLGAAVSGNGLHIQPFLIFLSGSSAEGGSIAEIYLKSETDVGLPAAEPAKALQMANGVRMEGDMRIEAGMQTGDGLQERAILFGMLAAASGSAAALLHGKRKKKA